MLGAKHPSVVINVVNDVYVCLVIIPAKLRNIPLWRGLLLLGKELLLLERENELLLLLLDGFHQGGSLARNGGLTGVYGLLGCAVDRLIEFLRP